jgi:hypothetical protein
MARKNKKAAIEMSMSTIVILVLAMAMLVLGLILIRNIFAGGTTAITKIGDGVNKEIDDLFTKTDEALAIYPATRKLKIRQGTADDGFAFSVRNKDLETTDFKYAIGVDPDFDIQDKCKIRASEADDWLSIPSGSFTLAGSSKMDSSKIVVMSIPESAPANCPIPYILSVTKKDGTFYTEGTVILTVQAK